MWKKSCSFIFITLLVSLFNISVAMSETTESPEYVTKLSSNVPSCPEDNNVNECIQNAFNFMLRSTSTGLPELNIPPIDPVMVNKLNFQFSNNLIRGKAAVRHVRLTGLSKSAVRNIQYQRNGKDIKINVHYQVPLIEITGQYRAEVLVNNAKLSSKGVFNVSLINVESKSEHYAELYEKDGHRFLKLTKINLDPTLGDMKIHATGLVPEPALNDALLDIINSNWRIVYKSVVSSTSSTWEPIVLNYSNEFFSHLPFDVLITNAKL
uniref:Uncharacterized protein n=1 Tax=Stomoxys calcitrans TaxID=35570 RepID=A0A1I8PYJ1_STOCA